MDKLIKRDGERVMPPKIITGFCPCHFFLSALGIYVERRSAASMASFMC